MLRKLEFYICVYYQIGSRDFDVFIGIGGWFFGYYRNYRE